MLWTKFDKYELKAKIKEEKEIRAKEKADRKKGVNVKDTEILDLSHYSDEYDTKKISDEIINEVDSEDVSHQKFEADINRSSIKNNEELSDEASNDNATE